MTKERALLTRLVANDDAMRDGTHMEHLLPHFDEQKAILADARALLAEPEGEASVEPLVAKLYRLHSLTGWALASETDALCEEIATEIRALLASGGHPMSGDPGAYSGIDGDPGAYARPDPASSLIEREWLVAEIEHARRMYELPGIPIYGSHRDEYRRLVAVLTAYDKEHPHD